MKTDLAINETAAIEFALWTIFNNQWTGVQSPSIADFNLWLEKMQLAIKKAEEQKQVITVSMPKMKYTAVKLKGTDVYVWFDHSKVTVQKNVFQGAEGWGKHRARTQILCNLTEIESYIYSDELQCQ